MDFGRLLTKYRERADLSKTELAHKVGVTPSYIMNIEAGRREAPSVETFEKMCLILNLSEKEAKDFRSVAFKQKIADKQSEWLQNVFNQDNFAGLKINTAAPLDVRKIPVISWVSANRFNEINDPFAPGDADEWVYTTAKGENMFALRVSNDCMEPKFKEGDIIIVNPHLEPKHGDFAVIRNAKKGEATFKQLKVYGDKTILHPLNEKYDDIVLNGTDRYEIIGKVVQRIEKF